MQDVVNSILGLIRDDEKGEDEARRAAIATAWQDVFVKHVRPDIYWGDQAPDADDATVIEWMCPTYFISICDDYTAIWRRLVDTIADTMKDKMPHALGYGYVRASLTRDDNVYMLMTRYALRDGPPPFTRGPVTLYTAND